MSSQQEKKRHISNSSSNLEHIRQSWPSTTELGVGRGAIQYLIVFLLSRLIWSYRINSHCSLKGGRKLIEKANRGCIKGTWEEIAPAEGSSHVWIWGCVSLIVPCVTNAWAQTEISPLWSRCRHMLCCADPAHALRHTSKKDPLSSKQK